jgi:maleate isomerase
MPSNYFKLGLVIPSSNTVMEPDFHRRLGASCVISTDRIYLEQVTREAEEFMIKEELPRALRLIKTTDPHVIVFGCTSAGSLGGLEHDVSIARMIEQQTATQAVTVVGSIIEQLRSIQPQNVAVFTPYDEDLTWSVAQCVAEAGYRVVKAAGMDILANRDIGRVTPIEILDFVKSQMHGLNADCIFLSCTNWQAIDAIDFVKAHFQLPVISSNQATMEAVRKLVSKYEAAASGLRS